MDCSRPSCVAARNAQAVYDAAYPDHCTRCLGSGVVLTYDGHWDGGGSCTIEETCTCLDEGRCPRCGREYDLYAEERCRHCAWDNGKNDGDVRPFHECHCENMLMDDDCYLVTSENGA